MVESSVKVLVSKDNSNNSANGSPQQIDEKNLASFRIPAPGVDGVKHLGGWEKGEKEKEGGSGRGCKVDGSKRRSGAASGRRGAGAGAGDEDEDEDENSCRANLSRERPSAKKGANEGGVSGGKARRRRGSKQQKPAEAKKASKRPSFEGEDRILPRSSPSSPSKAKASSPWVLFNVLLGGLERQIDEMYYHCEATVGTDGIGMVGKVEGLLKRGGVDFAQLKERIKMHSNHKEHRGGLSWDVRKSSATCSQSSSVIRDSIEKMKRDAEEERENLPKDNAWSKKLNFDTKSARPKKERGAAREGGGDRAERSAQSVKKRVSVSIQAVESDTVAASDAVQHAAATPTTDCELTDSEAIENVWAEAEAWVAKVEEGERREREREGMECLGDDGDSEDVKEAKEVKEAKVAKDANKDVKKPAKEEKKRWVNYESSEDEDDKESDR